MMAASELFETQDRTVKSPASQRRLLRTTAGLEPFAGSWNQLTAAHLVRRTMFAAPRNEILSTAASSLDATVNQLLSSQPAPPIPPDPNVPGRDWTVVPFSEISQINYQYDSALKQWWMGLMVKQGISIVEKMTLFWHNHLASQAETVRDARYLYKQNALYRQYALGNIKQLIKEVTIDPAMLVYLNGNKNRIPTPDENYARELLELFTIGKGPQVGDGDYTNYTEQDVQSAARVLTGWTTRQNVVPPAPNFVSRNHDFSSKQFSAAFQNSVIATTLNPDGTADGYKEMSDLIELIFAQPETAKAFCRKLYRWFVYYDIDPNVEQNVIVPLANILRQNNFEIKPVLNTLFRSAHFFDMNNVGCFIKSPVDLVAGSVRQFGFPIPDSSNVEFTRLMDSFIDTTWRLQMDILDPPNVAGWSAYYQIPDFYEIWINTTTLPTRGRFTDSIVNGIRPRNSSASYKIDPVAYAATLSDPGNPFALIDDIANDLLPPIKNSASISPEQKEYLLYSVMGLVKSDEYEWTDNWIAAHQNPPVTTAVNLVTNKLKTVLKFMMRMAEFQLT
ncbi:MAG: DUF1800 domain-containing protein [Ignavibacteriales bacterium]|nr:DUF1800 domain-containing protein [Ignavibacteriales bacterium]